MMMVFRMFICACLIAYPVFAVYAQSQNAADGRAAGAATAGAVKAQPSHSASSRQQADAGFNPREYHSLVFTHWEHVAIGDARRSRGKTRSVTEAELIQDMEKFQDQSEKVKPPPEEREIRLSGIVYHSTKDWTIWLNEQRVTPTAIPEEVMDLKVYKTYVEFKWYDEWTNRIFPIRLRPHQRFNIDTRIFLPG